MKRFFIWIFVAIAIGTGIWGCSNEELSGPDNGTELKSASGQTEGNFVPNEMLVKFKAGVSDSKKGEVLEKLSGKVKEKILTKAMERMGDNEGVTLVSLPGNAMEAISKAKDLPEIEYAEPNWIYTHDAVSNDTYYASGQLWGMNGTYGCKADVAWGNNHTGSATVYIGIIDEGYMYMHADLAANAGTNPGEIAGNGIDDDGNGYVDDVYGWDFDGNNNTVFDGIADDHGTYVAGTIAGVGGNGIGVAGVCWTVKLLNAKFLGNRGGTTANAIKAVDYFTNLKNKGVNIVATNNSWGGGGYSKALETAIKNANTAGILFIAAAGNSGTNNDATASYPSNYNVANVIAVAAIDKTGNLASFSQYGANTVDLGAPGVSIISTVPVKSGKSVGSGYASYSGTSMATPHVTGAAALYASTHSGANADAIKAAILAATVSTPSLSGKCVTGGRLNVSGF